MTFFTNILLASVFLSILVSLASNRLMELVKIMAFQGVVVSIMPLVLEHWHSMGLTGGLFLTFMISIKGIIMPLALYFAIKKVANLREIEPYIGYNASIFTGLVIIMTATFVGHRLAPYLPPMNSLLLPAGISTIGGGFFLMMSRHKAITQVIGYLMLENGIYLVGTALAHETHTQYMLEFGVLLDLLTGVMVMGIILHHINKTFDDVDTGMLGTLKD